MTAAPSKRPDAEDTGMEKLRRLVGIFNSCSESFLDRYTIDELLKIYDAHMQCGWDLYPDQWTDRQVKNALRGLVPQFRYATKEDWRSSRVICAGELVPVYPKPASDAQTDAGYIAHRVYKPSGSTVVMYLAVEQRIDVCGARYAVVCRFHGTLVGETSKRSARASLAYPEFCEDCMAAVRDDQ